MTTMLSIALDWRTILCVCKSWRC